MKFSMISPLDLWFLTSTMPSPFFAKYVRGTDNIDFVSELKRIGMTLEEKYDGLDKGFNQNL